MLAKLQRGYELVDTYAKLNLKAEARKTYLGYLWWIIEPLLFVSIFYFVFNVILDSRKEDFLLFLICGKIPFLWISKSITNSAGSVLQNRGLLAQGGIQPLMFPLVTLQENFYKQLPVFVMLLGFALLLGGEPGTSWLWLPILVIANYLLILPIALAGALMTSFVPDIRLLLSLFTMFLMFVSGIFWDIRTVPDPVLQHYLLVLNPVAFILDAYRAVLMYGERPDPVHLAALCLGSALMLALVSRLFVIMRSAINTRVINQ
ncbi:MAG: ABC transporter permease [Methylohalobius sp. ZOD2]